MQNRKILLVSLLVFLFIVVFTVSGGFAYTFDRPIELIAAFSPGGGVDTSCRILAPLLEKELGTSVVVVNKPGAGGVLGYTYTAMARPDGYTMGLTNLLALATASASEQLKVDPRDAFIYLGATNQDAAMLAVHADSEFKDINELIEHLRENPESVTIAITGPWSMDGALVVDLASKVGIKMRQVNFEGGSDSAVAVLGEHVDVWSASYSEVKQFIESGDMRILAVAGAERLPVLPDVPSFGELGYSLDITKAIRAVFYPTGVDQEIVDTVSAAIQKVVNSKEYLDAAEKAGLMGYYLSPEDCETELNTFMEFFLELKKDLG